MSKIIDLDQIELLKVDGNKEFNHGVDCCITTLLKQERVNAIPIPEGATNGDMFKAMFPNIEVKTQMSYGFKNGFKVRVYKDEFSVFDLWFPTDWWNAPYKKEVEE